MDGDYEICLDNRMSTWAEKVVWFEVTIHDPVDDYYDDYIGQFSDFLTVSSYNFISDSEELTEMKGRNEDTETMFDMKSDQINTPMSRIYYMNISPGCS